MSDESPAAHETDFERTNRNWQELLQELRVTQTGVQILTAFLLVLPFQRRFPALSESQEWLYVGVLMGSIVSTGLIVAPVCFHRVMFRQRLRPWLVDAGDRAARAGLLTMALTMSGAVLLVVDVAVGRVGASIAALASVLFFAILWWALPISVLRRTR
ncbi:MAG TPA: DUF6328 family protein [Nocardioidaceae bacterium]|nr:DUF6328 family protein [Nocardioidaceae bacterium]